MTKTTNTLAKLTAALEGAAALGLLTAKPPVPANAPTFERFRDGAGGRVVEDIFGLDIDRCYTWADFRALAEEEIEGDAGMEYKLKRDFEHMSTAQKAIGLALFRSIGDRKTASEIAEDNDTSFGYLAAYTIGNYGDALRCAIAQIDTYDQTPFDDRTCWYLRARSIKPKGVVLTQDEFEAFAKGMGLDTVPGGISDFNAAANEICRASDRAAGII